MSSNPFSRVCPNCKFDRIPETCNVKEGRTKYIVFKCPMCKHQDIERWHDRPRPKVWDGKSFLDEDFDVNPDRDEG